MKQEDKNLLIKDICARLPFGVKVGTTDNDGSLENVWDVLWYNTFTEDVKLIHSTENAEKMIDISEVKPYLFPLSSMTEEQRTDLTKFVANGITKENIVYDWYNKNHFDYRGLIPMGAAIDATKLNIY